MKLIEMTIIKGDLFNELENFYRTGIHSKVIRVCEEAYPVGYPGTYGSAPSHIPITEYRRVIMDNGEPGWTRRRLEERER